MNLRDLGDLDRYGWVHELVDDRPAVRARALARHRRLLGRARHHGHGGARTGTLADPVRAFTSLVPPSWSSAPGTHDPEGHARLAPYGLLFLQWEQRFPEEWRPAGWPFSLWPEKEAVLRAFCAGEPTPLTGPALEDLLIAAVRRTQRCQDRRYWSLARRIDTPGLRGRLAEATAESETARLRAGYVLWLLDHPGQAAGSAAWLRWRRSHGCPVTVPATAAELGQMKPAAAAALLAGLPAPDLARVLEGLHAGPAARMLKSMDPPAAIRLLEAMDPAAAAARLTGPTLTYLLTGMDSRAARAVLRAMSPAMAGQRLAEVTSGAAAALLQPTDPAFTASVLARMSWRDAKHTLLAMPPDTAAPLPARLRRDPVAGKRRDLDFDPP
jgi:flagellar motility protein MotE (MotC chaperone)